MIDKKTFKYRDEHYEPNMNPNMCKTKTGSHSLYTVRYSVSHFTSIWDSVLHGSVPKFFMEILIPNKNDDFDSIMRC